MNLTKPLTKTLFVSGTTCSRLMYYMYHYPKEIPKGSLGVEFRKRQGNIVGDVAKVKKPVLKQMLIRLIQWTFLNIKCLIQIKQFNYNVRLF